MQTTEVKEMNVKQAAKQAGTSVRTLRYYEEIGLIQPARNEENDYREYNEKTLAQIRLIRTYRELQFSLDEIRHLLTVSRMERDSMLEQHIQKLENKRRILDNRISLAQTLRMMGPERFTEIDFGQVDAQIQQVKENLARNEQWLAVSERLHQQSPEKAEEFAEALLQHLADIVTVPQTDLPAAIESLKTFITANLYPCTPAVLQYYARTFGGDGLLAQTLEDRAGPDAPKILRQRLDPQNI